MTNKIKNSRFIKELVGAFILAEVISLTIGAIKKKNIKLYSEVDVKDADGDGFNRITKFGIQKTKHYPMKKDHIMKEFERVEREAFQGTIKDTMVEKDKASEKLAAEVKRNMQMGEDITSKEDMTSPKNPAERLNPKKDCKDRFMLRQTVNEIVDHTIGVKQEPDDDLLHEPQLSDYHFKCNI